jgi:hypothetical protein
LQSLVGARNEPAERRNLSCERYRPERSRSSSLTSRVPRSCSGKYAAPVLEHSGTGFGRGREQGRRLSLEEAVAYALEELE